MKSSKVGSHLCNLESCVSSFFYRHHDKFTNLQKNGRYDSPKSYNYYIVRLHDWSSRARTHIENCQHCWFYLHILQMKTSKHPKTSQHVPNYPHNNIMCIIMSCVCTYIYIYVYIIDKLIPSGYLTWPWKITMLLIGKPSISMGHLYHGYVSHSQRVTDICFPTSCGASSSCRMLK